MKDFKFKVGVIIACGLLMVAAIVGAILVPEKENKTEAGGITTNLKVTIDGEEIRETIELEKGDTVEDQYRKAVLEFDDSAGYVTKVGNKSAEGMCGFVFEVNDEEIMKAASDVKLNDGDTVHWFYVCFE